MPHCLLPTPFLKWKTEMLFRTRGSESRIWLEIQVGLKECPSPGPKRAPKEPGTQVGRQAACWAPSYWGLLVFLPLGHHHTWLLTCCLSWPTLATCPFPQAGSASLWPSASSATWAPVHTRAPFLIPDLFLLLTLTLSWQLALALTRSRYHFYLTSHIRPLFSPLRFSPCIFDQQHPTPWRLTLQYQTSGLFSLIFLHGSTKLPFWLWYCLGAVQP